MRKQVEISDRFDSKSETEWIGTHWKLEPHTRDIKPYLLMAVMAGMMGSLGYIVYIGSALDRWRSDMRRLYAPYEAAVTEIERLEYCDAPWCSDKKEELIGQRDRAWKKLCDAEYSEDYLKILREHNSPYQSCD